MYEKNKETRVKLFVDVVAICSWLFLLSVNLYRVDAFGRQTFIFLLLWLADAVLLYASYKINQKYEIYNKWVILPPSFFLPAALLAVLYY